MLSSIDLHIHSSCSDGLLSPAEIISLAIKKSVAVIALTDHDTIAGIPELLSGNSSALKVLSGIELSAHSQLGPLHILGYDIAHNSVSLNLKLNNIQKARKERNRRIIDKLYHLGFDISLSYTDLENSASGQLGRPHIASLLVQKGVVKNENEAFIRFLKKNSAAYVARQKLPVDEAMAIIRQAGGLAVLAHPATIDPTCSLITRLISKLKDQGLNGLEVYHPIHTAKQIRIFSQICSDHDLIPTGGSDFHGRGHDRCILGCYGHNRPIAYSLWQGLQQRISNKKTINKHMKK